LDVRPNQHHRAGTIPITYLIHPESYENVDIMSEIPDSFFNIRRVFHIGLLGYRKFRNSTFDLSEYDENQIDVVQNMLENLLIDFNNKGFPYISIVDGGYEKCHNFAKKHSLEL
jgi:hypothetical protein